MASFSGCQLAIGPVLVPFSVPAGGEYAVPHPRSPLITVAALAVTAAAARTAKDLAAPSDTCVVYAADAAGPAITLIATISVMAGIAAQARTWRLRMYMGETY